MANLDDLIKTLKRDEGKKLKPYKCSAGYWTIGFGSRYIYGKEVTEHTPPITSDFAEDLLMMGIAHARRRAMRFATNYHKLGDQRREALINMCYQLGNRVFQFVKARKAINAGLWGKAYHELLDSKWAKKDTPKRAKRVALKFLT